MNSLIIDAPISEEKKRELLYQGQLLVYLPTPNSLALVEFARKMVEAAFHPLDPETAQFHLPVEKYAAILSELKPKFIHAPESKKCIHGMLKDLGFSLEKTYFDVPRMRSSTSDDFLTSGIAYAFHPHRDTWQWLCGLQLRGMEPHEPAKRRAIHQAGHEETAQAGRTDRAGSANPGDCPAGSCAAFFRGANAFERAEQFREDTVQHRFSHGKRGRRSRTARGAERRFSLHGDDDGRLPARNGLVAPAGEVF